MSYKELLIAVAKYGRGVFSVNMLESLKDQNALKQFIIRNPLYFQSFPGRNGDLVIRSLTSDGFKYLGISARLSKAENWYSYLDMLMLNSYMQEMNEWVTYSTKPPIVNEIGGKKVGLISLRWGLSKPSDQLDIILAVPHYNELIAGENQHPMNFDLPEEFVKKIHIPRALQSLRKSVL